MDVVELIKILILGVVEGVTEFLPISSTGHLLVVSALLHSETAQRLGGTLEIFIQIGAVVAVLAFYHADIWRQIRTVFQDRGAQRLWTSIVIASIPAAIFGFLLRDVIKEYLFSPAVIGVTLILGGVLFLWVERRPHQPDGESTTSLEAITLRQALWIGFAQTTALIPGVSRSGASIISGMLSGIDRKTATAFSFYLAIPVLGGATVLDLLLSMKDIAVMSAYPGSSLGFNLGAITFPFENILALDLTYLMLGAVISGIISWIAIGWLLRYVSRNNFAGFGVYRIGAGTIILILVFINVL